MIHPDHTSSLCLPLRNTSCVAVWSLVTLLIAPRAIIAKDPALATQVKLASKSSIEWVTQPGSAVPSISRVSIVAYFKPKTTVSPLIAGGLTPQPYSILPGSCVAPLLLPLKNEQPTSFTITMHAASNRLYQGACRSAFIQLSKASQAPCTRSITIGP